MININQKVKKHLEEVKNGTNIKKNKNINSKTKPISPKNKKSSVKKINRKIKENEVREQNSINHKNYDTEENVKVLSDKLYKIMFDNRQKPDDEEWKDVIGYEGIYMVSNYGLVIRKNNYRIIGTYYTGDEPWNHYYNIVNLSKNGIQKVYNIHRLVALAFVENPNPEKYNIVNHIDENIHNNYYKNLEWCDNQYNLHYGSANKKRVESIRLRKEWNEYIKNNEIQL